MKQIEYLEFIIHLEKQIRSVVQDTFPRPWTEDYLSENLVKKLTKTINGVKIVDLERPFDLKCDAFKLKGTCEQTHGDIAILVVFESWEGEKLEGVGFLEAKKNMKNLESMIS